MYINIHMPTPHHNPHTYYTNSKVPEQQPLLFSKKTPSFNLSLSDPGFGSRNCVFYLKIGCVKSYHISGGEKSNIIEDKIEQISRQTQILVLEQIDALTRCIHQTKDVLTFTESYCPLP